MLQDVLHKLNDINQWVVVFLVRGGCWLTRRVLFACFAFSNEEGHEGVDIFLNIC